jgi:hypothetical protein
VRFRVWLLDLLATWWGLVFVLVAAVFGMAAIATLSLGVDLVAWLSTTGTLVSLLIVVFLAYIGAASERDAPPSKAGDRPAKAVDPRRSIENGDGSYTITDTLGAARYS